MTGTGCFAHSFIFIYTHVVAGAETNIFLHF